MKIQKVKITELKELGNNPRNIKDAKFIALCKSIKEFPQMLELRPIVVDEKMVVIGGNMRLKAAKEIGMTEIPVIVASELTDAQQNEFVIKDNVSFGQWDWDLLANEWDAPALNDWGMDVWIPKQDDFFPVEEDMKDPENNPEEVPRASGDNHSIFQLVMLHDNKKILMDRINTVKKDMNLEKIEDALMYLIE